MVIIQNINVLEPFKIKGNDTIYKFSDNLSLLYFSSTSNGWEKAYNSIQKIVLGIDEIYPVRNWNKEDIIMLENLYLFDYRTITLEEELGYVAHSDTDSLLLNEIPQYQNIIEQLSRENETSWEIKEILKDVCSKLDL